VAISASITYDDQGNEIGSIGFAKDIREIRRRDQLVTLAELAIGVSHEINNSLEVVVNQIDMLRKYVGRAASDEDYLVESERLDSLVSQVEKIQDITGRISQMADEGEYGTKEYLNGKMMADLHVAEAKPCDRRKKDARYPLSGLRVLIVDDDAHICDSLKDVLEGEQCCIETAVSGIHAMDWLRREPFDLVLSDVVMPDMDGYELYKNVKCAFPHLPVVLMTAFNYDKDHIIKRSCLEGLQGVIFKKPVNPAMLKKILLQQCRPEQNASPAAQVSTPPDATSERKVPRE
jgi:CheY-like chemotaxis protein